MEILDAAREYVGRGWPIIPLVGKAPAVAGWQSWTADEASALLLFGMRRCGVGLRTGESGFVVVDTDTDEAEAWAAKRLPDTPMKVRTGGGSLHRYYGAPPRKEVRNKQGWKKIPGLDVRGAGGFIVLPPSRHPETGRPYEWSGDVLEPAGLPRFSPDWLRERTRKAVQRTVEGTPEFMEYRARKWLEVRDGAVSGSSGHNHTYATACKLVLYFGLNRETAIRLMLEIFNPKCSPPWDLPAIEHKVDDAMKRRN
jgi:hypothetical protein